ncbi:hypothetical protein [Streptomyces sp. NPDC029526]|uniref:hypothetical protein n=1 Tax=Streptomyces sp. NPDC029526 TaxID=3155728 RepID=UPI0033CF6102
MDPELDPDPQATPAPPPPPTGVPADGRTAARDDRALGPTDGGRTDGECTDGGRRAR